MLITIWSYQLPPWGVASSLVGYHLISFTKRNGQFFPKYHDTCWLVVVPSGMYSGLWNGSFSSLIYPLGMVGGSKKHASWQGLAQEYTKTSEAKIPVPLRLHPSVTRSMVSSSDTVIEYPKLSGHLSDEEIDITENYDAVALLEMIASRRLSSVKVTTAFCKRAAICHQIINCLTEIMFEEALKRAAYCDNYLANEGRVIGPFHGLPISLKDPFSVKGVRSTLGYIEFSKKPPASENSALVDVLLSQGAVLYVKTNIPQTLMASDTHNNLFGRTLNPHKMGLTVGGSSGGEAALIAMRGSVLGVGTDIAGGLRIPALCCGVIGFKPSTRRIPSGGQAAPGRRGSFGIHPSVGPICSSVRDATYFMRCVLEFDSWTLDEDVLSVPWLPINPSRDVKYIGVLFEDPKYPLHPPVLRNYKAILHKISNAGHKLISLNDKLPVDIISTTALTAMTILKMDPEKTSIGYVARGGEPLVPSATALDMPELARMKPNINGVFLLNTDISNLRKMFRKVFVDNSLDAILMPTYQTTAIAHDMIGVPAYTVLANILDYPSCVLPFGRAEKSLDLPFTRDTEYTPPYNPHVVEGAPCGIQIIGRNMKDEDLLATAQIIEDILKK